MPTITGASNTTPIVITSPNHGLANSPNLLVSVTGVFGNTAANGTWPYNVIDKDNFSLTGSQGNGVFIQDEPVEVFAVANELTINANLTYDDGSGSDDSLAVANLLDSVSLAVHICAEQVIGLTEEPINLGDAQAPGWVIFINTDPTNFVDLRVGTGGAKFARLKPVVGFAMLYMGPDAQVPFAIADTAPCKLRYLIANQ